jgi:hypothetical protein
MMDVFWLLQGTLCTVGFPLNALDVSDVHHSSSKEWIRRFNAVADLIDRNRSQ